MKNTFLIICIISFCSCGTYKKVLSYNSVTGATDTIYYNIVPGNHAHFKQRAAIREKRKQNLLTKNL